VRSTAISRQNFAYSGYVRNAFAVGRSVTPAVFAAPAKFTLRRKKL